MLHRETAAGESAGHPGPPRLGRPRKPFQLNPGAPEDGLGRQAYRVRKFGSLAYSQQLEARVAAAGAEEEIEFHFDQIKRTPNTMEAHRLIWFAGREQGLDGRNLTTVQNAVVEKLFRVLHFLQVIHENARRATIQE